MDFTLSFTRTDPKTEHISWWKYFDECLTTPGIPLNCPTALETARDNVEALRATGMFVPGRDMTNKAKTSLCTRRYCWRRSWGRWTSLEKLTRLISKTGERRLSWRLEWPVICAHRWWSESNRLNKPPDRISARWASKASDSLGLGDSENILKRLRLWRKKPKLICVCEGCLLVEYICHNCFWRISKKIFVWSL